MSNLVPNTTAIVQAFVEQITAAIEAAATARIQTVLASALGAPAGRRSLGAAAAAAIVTSAPAVAPGRRAAKLTPKLIKARKLQGQYLGALKSLSVADKAKVKAVAKAKGVPEAVKLAASLKRAKQ
jgi:hypothetical protein